MMNYISSFNRMLVIASVMAGAAALPSSARAQADCGAGEYTGHTSATACGSVAADFGTDPASAETENTTAIGASAIARSYGATAVGAGAFAGPSGSDATNATAIGSGAIATGQSAIGIGDHGNFDPANGGGAFGDHSIAIGTGATAGVWDSHPSAGGTDAIAIGTGAKANFDNSVAIGAGAVATQSNQFVFGTTSTTSYVMPGLPAISAGSADRIVTVDPTTGALTTSSFTSGDITTLQDNVSTLQGQMTTVQGDVSSLQGQVSAVQGNVTTLQGQMTTVQDNVTTLQGQMTTVQGEVVTAQTTADNAQSSADAAQATADGALQRTGGTMTGEIGMGNNRITNLAGPVSAGDAVNMAYVDSQVAIVGADVTALRSDVDGLSKGLNSAFEKIDENAEGIALAIALGGIALPQGKDFAVAANLGFYDGHEAFAAQAAIKLDNTLTLNGGIGTGFEHSKVGGRVGIMAAW
jgi:hypothetical protein